MADASDRLSELKIDRSNVDDGGRGWLLPLLAVGLIASIAVVWLLLDNMNGAVEVETEIARRPPSAAAASSVLDASGYVTARREATVSSEVTGKVVEVLIEEGMSVEAGQVVARLDDTTQRAQLALANAQLQSARAALAETEAQLRAARLERDRLRELALRQLVSTSSVDEAEANYDALAARLATGRENVKVADKNVALSQDALNDMTIRAPFGGMVVSKNAQPGEMISPISAGGGFTRTGICTIVDMDSLEIEVDVNEAYIQRVKQGQPVSATLDAYPNWQIPADVIAIVPTADRQKATVRVRIGFRERDERILRDMGVKVAFLGSEAPPEPSGEQPGVLISNAALQQDAAGDFVWRVANNKVERRSVTLGSPADRERVLVLDGLRPGDTIVRSATEALTAGQEVTKK
ncbi:MAG: efflux RND transporter periplasmic adaptor subunit [Gammaproteobacteria bacterium]|nr:efflux RND transporter periplasmic adaptor subunit [Gammaproteobacteria bacterium]